MTPKKFDSPGIRQIVLVMGLTGWGKSWWTKLYSQKFQRKLVYDPTMTFPVQQYQPIDEIVSDLMAENAPKVWSRGFVDAEELPQAGGLAFVLQNNCLIVEECATVFDKGLARLPDWGRRHCFYGRHMGCSLVLIAQRPTYIPIDFRSQANRVITFCQHEGADMDWLQDFFGRERVQRMMTLPKFTCFDYCDGRVSEYSIVKQVKEEFGVSLDTRVSTDISLLVHSS